MRLSVAECFVLSFVMLDVCPTLAQQSGPYQPKDVTGAVDSAAKTITLSWTPVVGTGITYSVFRAADPHIPDVSTTAQRITTSYQNSTYADKTLTAGTYNYIVVATDSAGHSSPPSAPLKKTLSDDQTSGSDSSNQDPAPATTILAASCPQNTATTKYDCVTAKYAKLPDNVGAAIDIPYGIMHYEPATLNNFITDCKISKPDENTTWAFNVLRLKSDNSIDSSQWYLYESPSSSADTESGRTYAKGFPLAWGAADFTNPGRLYGSSQINLVSIIVNSPTPAPSVTYVVQSTKAQPTNVADFLSLLSIVLPGNGVNPGAQNPTPNPTPTAMFSCSTVNTVFSTSTIQFTASVASGASKQPSTSSQTTTNEAKAWWDVSVALPVKKASALQYNSTAGTVTATQLNKENLFATLDFYPFRTDLKAAYSFSPGFFWGVSLGSRPLDSELVGVSLHFTMVSVYAGALFIKQQQLNGVAAGGAATPTQLTAATSFGFKPSFSVGIKLSTKSAASTLSSSTSKQ